MADRINNQDIPVRSSFRRRVGLILAVAAGIYLTASWLQVGVGPTEQATQVAIRGGWILIRPFWLYPVLLLAVTLIIVTVILFGRIASGIASRGSWREVVYVHADFTQHEVDILCSRAAPRCKESNALRDAIKKQVNSHVWAARGAVDRNYRGPIDRLIDLWTGASIEAAFRSLHAAEVAMVPLLPDEELEARIPKVLARLGTCSATDPRRRAAERNLRNGASGQRRRAEYAAALKYGYEIKDTEHVRVREFRNILVSATIALTAVVAALCLVGASFPDAVPLCFNPPGEMSAQQGTTTTTLRNQQNTVCPSEEQPPGPRRSQFRRLPAPGDVTLVSLFGLLGGALSGAFAIRKMYGHSTPYAVPVALALLKLPSGSLTAIVGILLVRGEFVPGLSQLDNQPQILAYAFFFGAAQQIATRFVDERAREVLGSVPTNAAPSDQDKTKNQSPEPVEEQTTPSGKAARSSRRGVLRQRR